MVSRWLFDACGMLFIWCLRLLWFACCMLVGGGWLLVEMFCVVFVLAVLVVLCVVCCVLRVACCVICVCCCLLVVVCCLLCVACCVVLSVRR